MPFYLLLYMIIEFLSLRPLFNNIVKYTRKIVSDFEEHYQNNKTDPPKDVGKNEFMLILMGIVVIILGIFCLYVTIVVWVGTINCVKNSTQGAGVKITEILFNFFPGVLVKWIVSFFTNSYCWLT